MRDCSVDRFLFAVVALSWLASCSSGGGSGGSGGGGAPPATPYIYASEGSQTGTSIYSYPLTSFGGSVAPATTTTLPSGDSFVLGIKSNGTNVFVLSRNSTEEFAVSVYTASKGVLTLVRTFQGDLDGELGFAAGFAADASGKVYIGQQDGTIAIYGATASGVVQAASTFNVGTNFINNLAFDTAGNLYVLISGGRGILYEYAAGLASTTPMRTVPITAFEEVNDMLVDGSGNVYLTGKNLSDPTTYAGAIVEYGPGSSTPVANNASFTLVDPSALAMTSTGTLYVQGWSTVNDVSCTYLNFPPSATGDANPNSFFVTPVSCGFDSGRMTIE
jgi:hypothetical protein